MRRLASGGGITRKRDIMATPRKPAARKRSPAKSAGVTKAKVRRVARKAKARLDEAAHEADLALRRTQRKLERTAQDVEARLEAAKAPAKRKAKHAGARVLSALQGASDSLIAVARKAKKRIAAAQRSLAPAKPAKAAKRPARKRAAA
jgi:hypothetical protein